MTENNNDLVVKCECCEEPIQDDMKAFSIKLESESNGFEQYNLVCNKCISAWMIECPEDIVLLVVSE